MLLPFNQTSKQLEGNRRFCTLKTDYIHVRPQNLSCQNIFVLMLTQIVWILNGPVLIGIKAIAIAKAWLLEKPDHVLRH